MMSTMTLLAAQVAPHNWGGAWWWWAPFAVLFWIGAVALVAFVLFRVWPTAMHQQSPGSRAREILAERFARGEMTPEEYDERLSHLS